MSVTSAHPVQQAVSRILKLAGNGLVSGAAPVLVLTVGLPASGKSTFARRLARDTGATILESDSLRSALFPTPSHSATESKRLFEAIYAAAGLLLRRGISVIVDATNLRESGRQAAYASAEEAGAQVLVLHFIAPEPVIAGRLERRTCGDDPDDRSSATMAVYRSMSETEEPISRDHWTIDTSDDAATEVALRNAVEALTGRPAAQAHHTGGTIS
jgi:predicted kinase